MRLAHRVDGRDGGMGKAGGGLRLAHEAGDKFGVGGQPLVQQLECDQAIEIDILRAPDFPHAT